ncbi:hypothetical protein Hanom_Chr05g00404351 [Helianthus anomalus]
MKIIENYLKSCILLISFELDQLNRLSIKPSGTHQWYQSCRDPPGPMAAQTLSEIEFYQWMNESLVKLESQLQTLCNEFRSFRTMWEAQSPTLPSIVSSTPPLVPSPASAATPQPASLLPQPTLIITPPPKTVPKPVPSKPKTAPKKASSTTPLSFKNPHQQFSVLN